MPIATRPVFVAASKVTFGQAAKRQGTLELKIGTPPQTLQVPLLTYPTEKKIWRYALLPFKQLPGNTGKDKILAAIPKTLNELNPKALLDGVYIKAPLNALNAVDIREQIIRGFGHELTGFTIKPAQRQILGEHHDILSQFVYLPTEDCCNQTPEQIEQAVAKLKSSR